MDVDPFEFLCSWAQIWPTRFGILIRIDGRDSFLRSSARNGGSSATFASAEDYLGSDCIRVSECLITDLQMPGMTGVDLQDRLFADGYRKPIIFMSALSAEEAPFRAKAAGAFGFLRKPFSDERLIECLEKALKAEDARSLDAIALASAMVMRAQTNFGN